MTQPPGGGGPESAGTGGLHIHPPDQGQSAPQQAQSAPQQGQTPGAASSRPPDHPTPLPVDAEPRSTSSGQSVGAPEAEGQAQRYLLWRAKKSNKPILALWLTPTAEGCELSSDIYPVKSLRVDPEHAGPFKFRRAEDAQAFAQEAARALMHLGCEIVEDERSPQPVAPLVGGLRVAAPPTSG